MTDLFDEDSSKAIEAAYLTPDVVEQREMVLAGLGPLAGKSVLDLGSGPGLLALDLFEAGAAVTGVDLAEAMLALARRRCPQAEFVPADVTELPFEDSSFDLAVSTQVYEYVPDMPRALAELRRVLKPDGRALILDSDVDSTLFASADPERLGRVMKAWEAHCHDPRLPRKLPRLLKEGGFRVVGTQALTLLNTTLENTFSGVLINFVAAFAGDDGQAFLAEQHELDARGEYFFALTRYLFVVEC